MKIRTNYVSNSSSSSFVVLFGNRKNFNNAVKECVDFIRNTNLIRIPLGEREYLVECFKKSISPVENQRDYVKAVAQDVLQDFAQSVTEWLGLKKEVEINNTENKSVSIINRLPFINYHNQFILLNPKMLQSMLELYDFIESNIVFSSPFYFATLPDYSEASQLMEKLANKITDEIVKCIPNQSMGMLSFDSSEEPYLTNIFYELTDIFDNNLCGGITFYNG